MKKLVLSIFVASVCLSSALCAQQTEPQKKQGEKTPAPEMVAESPQQEKPKSKGKNALTEEELAAKTAVLYEFVGEHHPALKRLLDLLESKHPGEYRKAMRTLSQQYDRLQRIKDKDPERYGLSLALWKVQSRIKYTSAQLSVDNSEKIEARLKDLLQQRWSIRIDLQRFELDAQKAKLEAMREDLTELRSRRGEVLAKQFQQNLARAQKRSVAMKEKKKGKARSKKSDEKKDATLPVTPK